VYSPSLGLVINTREIWENVQACLQESQARVVIEQTTPEDWDGLIKRLQQRQVDLLLLDIVPLEDDVESVIRRIKEELPAVSVIALHKSAEPEAILQAMRAGASEFLYLPFSAHLKKAMDRIATQREAPEKKTRLAGSTCAFLSAKGGCGATTIACHVALELRRHTGRDVLLADLDIGNGMIGFLMKARSQYSFLDAINNVHRLDASFWKALVSNGLPGIEVITAPTISSAWELPKLENLRRVLRFVKSCYQWSVVDLGRGLSVATMHALEEVDQTYLITTLEVPALHHAKVIVQTLLSSGYNRDNLRLVINRMPKRPEVTPDEIENIIGHPINTILPNDYPSLYEAYAEGQLLPEKSTLRGSLSNFALRIAGLEDRSKKKKFSLLG